MIESREKEKRLLELVNRWAEHTRVISNLRDQDIPGLVSRILEEFYPYHLCCGHLVASIDDCVYLRIPSGTEVSYGSYCQDCAEKYIDEGIAQKYVWLTEIKHGRG